MNRTSTLLVAGGVLLAATAVGTGIAVAAGSGDDDGSRPITGAELRRATAAALAHTGGGRVTETEDGDEESRYEVEVTLDDGTSVDVQLDADFGVVSAEGDHDDGADDDDAED
jgi:uncharacterized membrane protein YkoI